MYKPVADRLLCDFLDSYIQIFDAHLLPLSVGKTCDINISN